MKRAIDINRAKIVEIIGAILLVFLVHTLISSYIRIQSLKNLLAFYTVKTTMVAWIIIIIEVLVAGLIFLPRTRILGFTGMLFCVIYTGITIASHPHFPHDFGGIFNSISFIQKWILIGGIALLSITGIILSVLKKRLTRSVNNQDQIVVYT